MAMAMGACGEVEPFGQSSVTVAWDVAPLGCDVAGVEAVSVNLGNSVNTYGTTFGCGARQGLLTGVVPGTYRLELIGLDEAGAAVFGTGQREVFVRPDERLEVPPMDLTALPATVQVRWYFENQSVCGANGVSEVELTVFDSASYEVARGSHECDAGRALIEGVQAGDLWVRVRALGDGGHFEGVDEVSVKRGGEAQLEVGLAEINGQE